MPDGQLSLSPNLVSILWAASPHAWQTWHWVLPSLARPGVPPAFWGALVSLTFFILEGLQLCFSETGSFLLRECGGMWAAPACYWLCPGTWWSMAPVTVSVVGILRACWTAPSPRWPVTNRVC